VKVHLRRQTIFQKKEAKDAKRRGGFNDLNGIGGVFLAHQITNMDG
jgi:hypothetical protein